jgi:hypothetical protein
MGVAAVSQGKSRPQTVRQKGMSLEELDWADRPG